MALGQFGKGVLPARPRDFTDLTTDTYPGTAGQRIYLQSSALRGGRPLPAHHTSGFHAGTPSIRQPSADHPSPRRQEETLPTRHSTAAHGQGWPVRQTAACAVAAAGSGWKGKTGPGRRYAVRAVRSPALRPRTRNTIMRLTRAGRVPCPSSSREKKIPAFCRRSSRRQQVRSDPDPVSKGSGRQAVGSWSTYRTPCTRCRSGTGRGPSRVRPAAAARPAPTDARPRSPVESTPSNDHIVARQAPPDRCPGSGTCRTVRTTARWCGPSDNPRACRQGVQAGSFPSAVPCASLRMPPNPDPTPPTFREDPCGTPGRLPHRKPRGVRVHAADGSRFWSHLAVALNTAGRHSPARRAPRACGPGLRDPAALDDQGHGPRSRGLGVTALGLFAAGLVLHDTHRNGPLPPTTGLARSPPPDRPALSPPGTSSGRSSGTAT